MVLSSCTWHRYEALNDNMIHDRIVVGIQDSELDGTLTLKKVHATVRLTEAMKEQQPVSRGNNHDSHTVPLCAHLLSVYSCP